MASCRNSTAPGIDADAAKLEHFKPSILFDMLTIVLLKEDL